MEPLGQGGDGHRITRKKVNINGEDLEIISGDTSKLDPKEKKLLQADLEEGGEEYQDKDLWVRATSGGKRKVKEEEVLVTEVEPRPKRQKLITDFHSQENKKEEVQVQQQEVQHNLEVEAQTTNEENEAVQNLRDRMLAKLMVKRGAKAMKRSLRMKKVARKRYLKYTSQYEHLSRSGDKGMHKARREANKARENWMVTGRLDKIPEDEEPQEDPHEPPNETPGPESQGVQEPYQGKVRRLTDF